MNRRLCCALLGVAMMTLPIASRANADGGGGTIGTRAVTGSCCYWDSYSWFIVCDTGLTQAACNDLMGRYRSGYDCTGLCDDVGRCCYVVVNGLGQNEAACTTAIEAECDAIGGMWYAGVFCYSFSEGGGCVLGRCCYIDNGVGYCEENFHQQCSALGGDWSASEACDNPCPPVGACCTPLYNGETECNNTYEADCIRWPFNVWDANETCATVSCPQIGACCGINDGSVYCGSKFEEYCDQLGGVWHAGQTCSQVTCPAIGACCYYEDFGNPVCETLFEVGCQQLGGVWHSGEDCATFTCPNRADILVTPDGARGRDATIGMDGTGRFIVGWTEIPEVWTNGANIFVKGHDMYGNAPRDSHVPLTNGPGDEIGGFGYPSLAINQSSDVVVAFTGSKTRALSNLNPRALCVAHFSLGLPLVSLTPVITPVPYYRGMEYQPSVGMDGAGLAAYGFVRPFDDSQTGTDDLQGIVAGKDDSSSGERIESQIYCCNDTLCPSSDCHTSYWQPCVATREADGYFVVVYAIHKSNDVDPLCNIALQLFGPDAAPVGSEIIVNNPAAEVEFSDQLSPAVAFDNLGNIVCVWAGTNLPSQVAGRWSVFGRRLHWDGNPLSPITYVSDVFVVNDDSQGQTVCADMINPTVALIDTSDTSLQGSFIVAWNTFVQVVQSSYEIHGLFFNPHGVPVGSEFRVNQDTYCTTINNESIRMLGNSASHTLDYGTDGRVVCAYTTCSSGGPVSLSDPTYEQIFVTLLPGDFVDTLGETCCKADMNGDGERNSLDLALFGDILQNPPTPTVGDCVVANYLDICAADMNSDGVVDNDDISLFVLAVLGQASCSEPVNGGDCNGNSVPDYQDIDPTDPDGDLQVSPDCNGNQYPDECDIASDVSEDANTNGIPDECE